MQGQWQLQFGGIVVGNICCSYNACDGSNEMATVGSKCEFATA